METSLLKTLGQIAGLAGISLGVFLLLFREFIRKSIFPTLPPDHAYRLIRQFMYLTFLMAVVGIAAWVYVSKTTGPKEGEPKETLITEPNIGPQQIPAKMTEPLPSITGDALTQELRNRGSLTLDATTLTLGKSGAHTSISIACYTLRLQNGARILTNGNALTLQVQKMVFTGGGGIVSFDGDVRKASTGALGGPGFPGEHGGRVALISLNGMEGPLRIALPGQDGGDGGPGLQGDPGIGGDRGADSVQGFLECKSGGQDGKPGGQGGRGRTGGDGGRGGDGGELQLSGNLISAKSSILFEAPGGAGGNGGPGGSGGPGGPGGQGGSGGGQCSGGRAGSPGPAGPLGDPGHPGTNGRAGVISNF